MNLENLCVLVTRPKPQGESLCEIIQSAGGKPLYFPTIEILPPPDPVLFEKQISVLHQFDWVIFISPQAVTHSLPTIKTHWPILPAHLKISAIGAGTQHLLEECNINVSHTPTENWSSEGLLALLTLEQISNKKIAIIKGIGGRELLADTLKKRGAKVTLINAYQRTLPKSDTYLITNSLQKQVIDRVISTSNESLQNLLTMLGKEYWAALFDILLIVISERMVQFAKSLGFKKIVIAKNASHAAILDVLIKTRMSYGK